MLTRSNEDFFGTPWNRVAVKLEVIANAWWKRRNEKIDYSDYCEAVLNGLAKASKVYDPEKGVPILNFAKPWLNGASRELGRNMLEYSDETVEDTYELDESNVLIEDMRKLVDSETFEMVYRRFVEDWSLEELADEYGKTVKSVRCKLDKALRILREGLQGLKKEAATTFPCGHSLSPSNVYIRKDNQYRSCKTCDTNRKRKVRANAK